MGYFIAFVALLVAFDLSGDTKVILLDNNKTQNEITIKNSVSTQTLNEPNSYIGISSNDSKPSKVKHISNRALEEKYGKILTNSYKPISMLFYFKSGTDELTNSSKNQLLQMGKILNNRESNYISIIGHADRQGDDELNIKLSIKRAQKIATWIKNNSQKVDDLDVKSYGEMDPIIPTKDGVSEPKNRRVEVLIK